MFDVPYLIGYNHELETPVIVSAREPFHLSRIFTFETYQKFTGFFEDNSFLICRTIDGYMIVLAYDGALSGKVVTLYPDYKQQLNGILTGMEQFFRKERLERFPKLYKKYML